jgi:2-(1,2-epoxy-1,2-dihydrophenyl)acetyl-CoA isomerase
MSDLVVSIADHVAALTMNRPEARNALSDPMRRELRDALHAIELDDDVRCVVLRGAGDHFMAGGDVKTFAGIIDRPAAELKQQFVLRIHDLHPIMFAMRRMPKPVLASVRGAAAGAGVSMALACDLVIAADDAFFTLAYVNIGTTPDGSSTYFLPRTLGLKRALEMTFLGERIPAAKAAEWGLVNFVVPAAELEAETAKIARRLASGPTYVYGRAKALLYDSIRRDFESQLQAEAEAFAACAAREDFREGVTAFVEKRKPVFTGR